MSSFFTSFNTGAFNVALRGHFYLFWVILCINLGARAEQGKYLCPNFEIKDK